MLLYKDGGPHARRGGTFEFKGVQTLEEVKELLSKGYFLTMEGVETGEDPEEAFSTPEFEDLIRQKDEPEDEPEDESEDGKENPEDDQEEESPFEED